MSWSLKIAQVAGIGIFVHWTFFILLAWVAYLHVAAGDNPAAVVEGVGFVLALFACVVLHELGHAMTGRHFGVRTRDITLLPIGGVARLERIPEEPWQEFWIAVAGPAVNVVIAALLFVLLQVTGDLARAGELTLAGGSFVSGLMWTNVALVAFNLLPAFPMDGGRVLRALLALRMSRVKATHVSASIGQFMAILFGVAGAIGGQWMLIFIALFVYLGAGAESQATELRALLKGVRVADVMITRFRTLAENDPLESAVNESSLGNQQDFPVTDDHHIKGLLLHHDILKAVAAGLLHAPVSEFMRRDCPVMCPDEPLQRAFEKMRTSDCRTLLVQSNGKAVGLLSEEHLGQWIMLHSSPHYRLTDSSAPSQRTQKPNRI